MVKIGCVYWKDKIGGKTQKMVTEATNYGFTVGPHGVWEMVIAKEDKNVKKSELVNIKIETIELPPKSIMLPCPILRHALGLVPSLAAVGTPSPCEGRRTFDEALFLPVYDGVVNKGDLLCVMNVLYASIERRLARGAAEKWLKERHRY